jgi:hypothetical protein
LKRRLRRDTNDMVTFFLMARQPKEVHLASNRNCQLAPPTLKGTAER